jgi:hypothetical protein
MMISEPPAPYTLSMGTAEPHPASTCSMTDARKAKSLMTQLLEGDPNVVGIGICAQDAGEGFAIIVNLAKKAAASTTKGKRPRKIEGVPVRYSVVGKVEKR